MKSAIYVLLVFVLAALGLACSKSDDSEDIPAEITNELSASPVSLSFTADGGTQNISITSNTAWTISSNESWCSASRKSSHSNATVTITAKASYTESERSATITISGLEVDPISISVSQDAFQPAIASYIEPDASGMESDAEVEPGEENGIHWLRNSLGKPQNNQRSDRSGESFRIQRSSHTLFVGPIPHRPG